MYQKNLKSAFPADLSWLCRNVASAVHMPFEPEAAIVNFYPVSATMGGHLDDAEHTMDKPIVSISIGRPALFLLGGRVKSVKPTSVLLESGDIVVMGRESRFSYHGVPLILPEDFQPNDDAYFTGNNVRRDRIGSVDLKNSEVDGTASHAPTTADSTTMLTHLAPSDGENRITQCLMPSDSSTTTTDLNPTMSRVIRDFRRQQHGLSVAEDSPLLPIVRYLRQNRVNMNVRQVATDPTSGAWVDKIGTGGLKY